MAKDGFAETVKKVATIGYAGVETAGFPGTTPKEASKLFKELGLVVPSAHLGLPIGEQKNQILDTMAELGARQIVSPSIGREPYQSIEGIKKACERFNEANAVALENGYTFAVHNHWMEFQEVEGRNAHEVLLEHLDASVLFQLDTYWIKAAGLDPVAIVKKLGKRAPTLHLKDGPATREEPMMAIGEGMMDTAGIVKAGGETTEWLIVELDRCATDMLEAVEKSYHYLVSKGLAHGRKS
jgi:sugar phosphate isomerase/epimerase